MDEDLWRPTCEPAIVVPPVALDPSGVHGPTRGQARGRKWRAVGNGFHVPADVALTPEQRAADVAVSLPPGGQVTGWAALRLAGGGFFDGIGADGVSLLPVPIRIPHEFRRAVPGARTIRTTSPGPTGLWQSIPCSDVETAVLDEMALARYERDAVVVVDMALAAGLTTIDRILARLAEDVRRRGTRRMRWALELAVAGSASPRETLMRLVWVLDAGFAQPLVNATVVDLGGRFVGIADLLDVELGVAGEYAGALHRSRARHRSDVDREDRFRAVELETFTVVAGDSRQTQVRRMRAAAERAAASTRPRLWRVLGQQMGP